MSKPVKYSLFLIVLGIICAGLLAIVNAFTAPIINEEKLKKIKGSLTEVDNINNWEDITNKNNKNLVDGIIALYVAKDTNGEAKTIAYSTVTKGYNNGEINLLIFIDMDTKVIKKVLLMSMSAQTKDIGTKIADESYLAIFSNKNISIYANDLIIKHNSSSIDIISGATTSSKAVVEGVIIATSHYSFGKVLI